jgi:hypothetical protein
MIKCGITRVVRNQNAAAQHKVSEIAYEANPLNALESLHKAMLHSSSTSL